MKPLTVEQKEKLKRLVKLGIIMEGQDIISDSRQAVKVAFRQGIVTSWSDDGRFYILDIPKVGRKKLRSHETGEFIVDRLLKVKDALNETVEEKPAEEVPEDSTPEGDPEQEPKEVAPEEESEEEPERPLNYDDLNVSELKEICKKREISGYSTMRRDELVKTLEEDDARGASE